MAESLLPPSDAMLVRYLVGQSGPAEARAIERWLAEAAEHRQRLEDLQLILRLTEPSQITWTPARSWHRLAERIESPRRPEIVPRRPGFGASRWSRALIAAGVGAIVATGWYAERRATGARPGHPGAIAAMTERRTGRGERASFHLADGTEVMLGPDSRLRYSATSYGRNTRAVELEGDGYFEVVHDATRPFTVYTQSALVRDLGTRFIVRTRTADRGAEVAVAEGRVAVHLAVTPNARDSVVLNPGDAARVARSGRLEIQRSTTVERYFAWTEGRLLFERASLQEVVDELERWYDVDIELGSPGLAQRVLTAGFEDKPISDVLGIIAASLDVTVSGHGRRFVLTAR